MWSQQIRRAGLAGHRSDALDLAAHRGEVGGRRAERGRHVENEVDARAGVSWSRSPAAGEGVLGHREQRVGAALPEGAHRAAVRIGMVVQREPGFELPARLEVEDAVEEDGAGRLREVEPAPFVVGLVGVPARDDVVGEAAPTPRRGTELLGWILEGGVEQGRTVLGEDVLPAPCDF